MRPPPLPKFKCRVLIVDDVEDTREMYALYFTYLGWEVRLASDGAEGLAMAQAEHPDFLVLDLAMPALDGWEVGQQPPETRRRENRGRKSAPPSQRSQPIEIRRVRPGSADRLPP